MWRGLAATTSDIVVFVDADLQSFSTDYISGLTGPLLADSGLQLVKAIYERPLVAADQVVPASGGRVTELMARPLINRFWPELADMVQPLAGEYAGRRTLLESLPFPCGYGIELALMVDTYQRHGMAALGQVDLGVRVHRHHHTPGLGLMAAEILDTALRRVNPGDPTQQNPPELTQFRTNPRRLSGASAGTVRHRTTAVTRHPLSREVGGTRWKLSRPCRVGERFAPLPLGPQTAQPLDQQRIELHGRTGVDECIQRLVIPSRREPELIANRLLLGPA